MLRLLTAITFACFSTSTGQAQPTFLTWFDYPGYNYMDIFSRPIQTADNNFLISGAAYAINAGNYTQHAFAARVDTAGNLVWSKSFGNSKRVNITAVAENVQGYTFAGYISDNSVNEVLLLIRTNTNGDTLWTRKYEYGGQIREFTAMPNGDFIGIGIKNGMPAHQYVIRFDANGNVLWAKEFSTTPNIGMGGYTGHVCADESIIIYTQGTVVIKLDVNGNVQWSLPYYSFGNSFAATDIAELNDGSFILSGFFTGAGINSEGVVMKISATGIPLWIKKMGSATSINYLRCAAVLANGNILLNGSYQFTGSASVYNWAVQVDTSGTVLWSKIYGYVASGNIVGFGASASAGGFVSMGPQYLSQTNHTDLFLVRSMLDTSAICGPMNGPVVTTPLTFSNATPVTINAAPLLLNAIDTSIYTGQNVLNQNFTCVTTGIAPGQEPANDIKVYPNPFAGELHLQVSNMQHIRFITLFDCRGKIIRKIEKPQEMVVTFTGLTTGIYFLQTEFSDKTIIKKVAGF